MKFINILFIISIIASLFMSFILDSSFTSRTWLDSLFLVGLVLLLISSVLSLIEGRFFTAFISSFRHVYATVSRKEGVIRESEKRVNGPISFQNKFPSKISYFKIGISLCIVSLVASTLLYYFGR